MLYCRTPAGTVVLDDPLPGKRLLSGRATLLPPGERPQLPPRWPRRLAVLSLLPAPRCAERPASRISFRTAFPAVPAAPAVVGRWNQESSGEPLDGHGHLVGDFVHGEVATRF